MLNLLLLSLILIILNFILLSHALSLSHLHFQLCLQYLHVPVSLLVKQLLNTAVFVSVLRLSLSSVEFWAGQIQTAVCQGVKLAALQSIAGGQDCAQQLEKDPSPSSYTHTLPKYPPVPSLTLPHSQKEQEWFWDTEKRDWHMGTSKMCSLKCCLDGIHFIWCQSYYF